MGDSIESTMEDSEIHTLGSSTGSLDSGGRRARPPNKKRHDEELDTLQQTIKEKETELRSLTQFLSNDSHKNGLRSMRAEKNARIEKLKQIEQEVRSLNQEISKKKAALDRLQSSLHYKSEERIDQSITRLDYLLKRQNFKLSEEKKIVSEIDSLKRSKKVLRDYMAMKKENDDLREKQKHLRVERDESQKYVNQLRRQEEESKQKTAKSKARKEVLKKELDELHQMKRRMVQDFKQLEKEYQEVKGENRRQKRKESMKKKEESCTQMEAFQKALEEYHVQRDPYTDEINLCNTLIHYLQKYIQTSDNDPANDDPPTLKTTNLSASACSAELAAELEEGMYILRKKCDDDSEYPGTGRRSGKRRPSKKGKRLSSVTKPVTHTPQIFSQFASLNLNAPSNHSEIPASLEQLQARKEFYQNWCQTSPSTSAPVIEEHHASDAGISTSDAGISLTESGMCEMSRQASNTESTENPTELTFGILEELVKVSREEGTSETMSEVSEDTLGRSNSNSDSTEHAQSESDYSESVKESENEKICEKGEWENVDEDLSCVDPKREHKVQDTEKKSDSEPNICRDPGSKVKDVVSNTHAQELSDDPVNLGSKVKDINLDDCQENDYEFDLPLDAPPSVS